MKNVFRFLSVVIVLAAVVGGVYLVQKNQETRRGAAASETSSSILPTTISATVGQNFDAQVWLNTGKDTDKLSGAEFLVIYDSAKVKYIGSESQSGFSILNEAIDDGKGTLTLKMVTLGTEKGGAVNVLKITFKSVAGNGSLLVQKGKVLVTDASATSAVWEIAANNPSNYSVAGGATVVPTATPPARCDYPAPPTGCTYINGPNYNSATSCGKVLSCPTVGPTAVPTAVVTTTVTRYSCNTVAGTCSLLATGPYFNLASCESACVVPTVSLGNGGEPTAVPTTAPITGQDLVLNYKVAFGNVNPNSAKCAINWPLDITVSANGQTKSYEGVMPTSRVVAGNKLVFGGSLSLVEFTETNGVSVFVSGPKQLVVKYGRDKQVSSFDQVDGELSLDKTTNLVYDFSGYPLMAGDVVASDSIERQDGVINGVDFAYIKSKSLIHETVAEGGYLKGDLDGNCQVNSNDINIIKMSLQEKQDQLY